MLTESKDVRKAVFVHNLEVQKAYRWHEERLLQITREYETAKSDLDAGLRRDLDAAQKSLLLNLEVE